MDGTNKFPINSESKLADRVAIFGLGTGACKLVIFAAILAALPIGSVRAIKVAPGYRRLVAIASGTKVTNPAGATKR